MEMLRPELSLVSEADGAYTLKSVTMTPNGCFTAGLPLLGPPPGQLVTPETLAVTLRVNRSGEFCPMAITPVRHTLADLRLGAEHGKTHVTAFVVVNDLDTGGSFLAGQNSIPAPASAHAMVFAMEDRPLADGDQWSATANLKPPAPFTLHVQGEVIASTPGHRAHLTKSEPQGVNSRILLLDLTLEELPGDWPLVITSIPARYHDGDYPEDLHDKVQIRSTGGASWTVTIDKIM